MQLLEETPLLPGDASPREMEQDEGEHMHPSMNSEPLASVPLPEPRAKSLKWFLCRVFQQKMADTERRDIAVGMTPFEGFYPSNEVNNRRNSALSFLPKSVINQFRFSLFNIYFLVVALSQLVPQLQVGFMFTYIAPLAFVVGLSVAKDGVDDLKRYLQDRRVNSEKYEQLLPNGDLSSIRAEDIRVGMLLRVHAHQRIPADLVLLHTTEATGACFVQTDQLDGETDWKLRHPAKATRGMTPETIAALRMNVDCESPSKEIYKFEGRLVAQHHLAEGLNLNNTLWCSCTVASGSIIGAVLYTGTDTRSAMNAEQGAVKVSLVERELNRISVLCFVFLMILSVVLVVQQLLIVPVTVLYALINLSRFQILMSAIIPISMRVNLDIARLWYSFVIFRDQETLPGVIVRNTNIPEELGRLRYLFSDKTGTLTKNVMEFRTLHLDDGFSFEHTEVTDIKAGLGVVLAPSESQQQVVGYSTKQAQLIARAVKMLALCHNVTPVHENGETEFQAASPDEVAMVKFAAKVGVHLSERSISCTGDVEGEMVLESDFGKTFRFDILLTFPFSSERKCMGIILRDKETQQITYLMKGADAKMSKVVQRTSWLEEKCGEMAKCGRRTLVFASKDLTASEFGTFLRAHGQASSTPGQEMREKAISKVLDSLEHNMTLVCATGVEDQLQDNVIQTLERLSACGIKVWMLTGDKVETAQCIGRSTKLIPANCWEEELICDTPDQLVDQLAELKENYCGEGEDVWSLLLDGHTLEFALDQAVCSDFVDVAKRASAVIVARCSPTQKARVVQAVVDHCPVDVRTAAIGDGGNDVSMILAAHVGLGIEGVEGKQASMAADFSITQFHHCEHLITWHGRNSYKRSCMLAQFIMHRGLIYAICQAVFSMTFSGSSMALFNSYLIVLYPTVLTVAPVFALVLDEDRLESEIGLFPELYKDLLKSRSLNFCSFLQWVWLSFFEGGIMMFLALRLFQTQFFELVSIAYTTLIITEFVIIAACMHFRILWKQRRIHFFLFLAAEFGSVVMYVLAVQFLPDTFDTTFVYSLEFLKGVAIICGASIIPMVLLVVGAKYLQYCAVRFKNN